MVKFNYFQSQKILDSDYSPMTKELNRLLKNIDNIFSWELENRPLTAARNINELIKAVIEKSPTTPAKLEYRKDEFRLTKLGIIKFSLGEELEFRYCRKERIRSLTLRKLLRYLLWLLIFGKAKDQYLAKFTAWASVINFLQHYSDFFEFSDGAKINEYETLIINWRYYHEDRN
ncbi:hypothetical protein cce_5052 [Crocosphaera subtropica ATCC 51142]|uniref:Uncharacterized protein n=1 Tax=Crocosphaera subtropica (strain ATCC 51142 / BH68) TaxID=43989 RepID=B1X2N7_CROS5|nr:hypothetical protein [Crocosphaera subtropica]ACB54398.1 hypothetical protein cce_5052 [Crocosphaera subtropica ATCC 51142]